MGCYNEVKVSCPDCGESLFFQSKYGDCSMKTYSINHVPADDLQGIMGDTVMCSCGCEVSIGDQEAIKIDGSHLVSSYRD